MTDRLNINICGVEFKNPVIAASGTFGYGLEFARYTDLNKIGGISVKGISLEEAEGNPMPRIVETYSGMLNAIGLQNVGVNRFIKEKLPYLKSYDTKVIVNFWGKNIEEYIKVASMLDIEDGVDMLEMNISCPNIKDGGISFSSDPLMTSNIVRAVRKVIKYKPFIVKLSPNVTDIKVFARICENEGADGVSLINTLLGMSIDINKMKPKLGNITGGLSGGCIKPIAIRMVYEVAKSINIPIIGMGGIFNSEDALEFFMAGASAIQIGTANFINPNSCVEVSSDIDKYLENKSINNIKDIIGKALTK